jgi:hypothetical protein
MEDSASKFRWMTGLFIKSGNYVWKSDEWKDVLKHTKKDIWDTLMVYWLIIIVFMIVVCLVIFSNKCLTINKNILIYANALLHPIGVQYDGYKMRCVQRYGHQA